MRIDRRSLLCGAGALGVIGVAGVAGARAPLVGAQVPGVWRAKVGIAEVTALLDGTVGLDTTVFSGAAPEELAAILAAQGLGTALPTPVNAFAINLGDRLVLVDTGIGATTMFGPTLGKLSANLAAAGMTPDQVDAVILTHAHPDHADGLVDATGASVFPNAQVILAETEYAFWHDAGAESRAPEAMKGLFGAAQRALKPYGNRTTRAAPGEVMPGLTLEAAPGHTPGHSMVRLRSGTAEMLFVGDILHNWAIHTARPEIGFAFDADPTLAAQSRIRAFEQIATEGTVIAATHIAFPGVGRILRDGDHYRYVPSDWDLSL